MASGRVELALTPVRRESFEVCVESFEVCVETTVVVDTLGPARRRTYGLCVTVRCQWKKGPARRRLMDRYLCTYRIEKQCVKYTSLKQIRVGI